MNIQETYPIPSEKQFQKTILDNFDRMMIQKLSHESDPSIYFITTKFNDLPNESRDALARRRTFSGKYPESEERILIVHQWQYLFYKHVLNQTVSNADYQSKRKHYPVAVCFVDFPGSREHRPRITEIPHFHSVFVVPSRTRPKFDQLVSDGLRCP